jgi:hypothetical protein
VFLADYFVNPVFRCEILADDNRDAADSMAMLLELNGYEVARMARQEARGKILS